jgi:hypothetical protein
MPGFASHQCALKPYQDRTHAAGERLPLGEGIEAISVTEAACDVMAT